MYSRRTQENQDVFDLAIQEYGYVDFVFLLTSDNNLEPYSDLEIGQSLTFRQQAPEEIVISGTQVSFFKASEFTYKKRTEKGQDVFDMAIQEYGHIDLVFLMLADNNLEPYSDLEIGQLLTFLEQVPAAINFDNEILEFFRRNEIRVNTHTEVVQGYWETIDGDNWETIDGDNWQLNSN